MGESASAHALRSSFMSFLLNVRLGSHAPLCQSTKACGSIGVALPATAVHLASVSSFLDKALGNSDPASAVCRGAVAGKTSYDLSGSFTRPSTHFAAAIGSQPTLHDQTRHDTNHFRPLHVACHLFTQLSASSMFSRATVLFIDRIGSARLPAGILSCM